MNVIFSNGRRGNRPGTIWRSAWGRELVGNGPPLEPGFADRHGLWLKFRRPMMDVCTAKAVTGWDEDRVMGAIEDGRIRWAFNFGTGRRRFVVILTRSVLCVCEPGLAQPATILQVSDLLLPRHARGSGQVRGTELQMAFNITAEQVMKLRRAGCLEESRWSARHPGRGGSPLFTRSSVIQFLRKRRCL